MLLSASRYSQNGVSLAVAAIVLLLLGGCQSDEERLSTFLERGEEYVNADQAPEAIIEFKNVLQLDPENAAAHEALSLAYLKVEKPREAYWEMSETVRLDPQNVDARLRYGTVSAAIGDYDLSLEQAEAVLAIDPTNSAAYIIRAQAVESREDLEAAEADFRAALENDPTGAAYRFLLAGFLERRGRLDEAEQVLRGLIEVEESYFAVSALSRMLMRSKDRETEALVALHRSVELAMEAPIKKRQFSPEEDSRTTSLLETVVREEAIQASYLLLAGFHYDRGRLEKAIEVLEEGTKVSETKIELIYQIARMYRLQGMTEEENAMILRASEVSPDNIAAQLVLSAYLGRQEDLQGALKAARAAVAIDGENRTAQLREAELLIDIGYKISDAESIQTGRTIVDSVLEAEPDNPEAHFVRAKIELADSDIEAAKASLQKVLQARPDWAQARFVLGSALAASNDLSRARVEIARAVELEPQLGIARKLLAQLHAQLGEHEFAIEQGRTYLAQNPDDAEVRIIVGQSLIRVGRGEEAYAEVEKIPEDQRDGAALFALGRLDLAFGRAEQGAERLRQADKLAPGNSQILRTLLAIDRVNGDLDASVARVKRALEASPEETEIAEVEAEVKLLTGDVDGARVSLERAIKLEPRNVTAQVALADLEAKAGNVPRVIELMESASLAVPESSDLQYRLAVIYENNNRRPDAMDAYEKSISLNPDLAIAKNNLAYLLADTGGDLDRALELAQQAKEQLPDDASAADTLGWVLVKRGVPSAAIGYLQEAAERFPSKSYEVQGIVGNHLAEAYENNKEVEKAIKASRTTVSHYENLSKIAKGRGIEFDEPNWSRDARSRIARLSADS